jgi:hypothetical protein
MSEIMTRAGTAGSTEPTELTDEQKLQVIEEFLSVPLPENFSEDMNLNDPELGRYVDDANVVKGLIMRLVRGQKIDAETALDLIARFNWIIGCGERRFNYKNEWRPQVPSIIGRDKELSFSGEAFEFGDGRFPIDRESKERYMQLLNETTRGALVGIINISGADDDTLLCRTGIMKQDSKLMIVGSGSVHINLSVEPFVQQGSIFFDSFYCGPKHIRSGEDILLRLARGLCTEQLLTLRERWSTSDNNVKAKIIDALQRAVGIRQAESEELLRKYNEYVAGTAAIQSVIDEETATPFARVAKS